MCYWKILYIYIKIIYTFYIYKIIYLGLMRILQQVAPILLDFHTSHHKTISFVFRIPLDKKKEENLYSDQNTQCSPCWPSHGVFDVHNLMWDL